MGDSVGLFGGEMWAGGTNWAETGEGIGMSSRVSIGLVGGEGLFSTFCKQNNDS